MRGVLLPGDKRVLVETFPDPTPGVGEVVVRVKASAICRSDLSLYYGNAVVGGDRAGKFITGHEPAGVVEAVGDGVSFVKPGDRVAIHLAIGCGHCAACRAGNFHMCNRWECLGFTMDGGNAEFLRVPERNCMLIPDAMSFTAACVSTDAFGTLYSAVKKLGVNGNTTLAIFGLGPMGSAGTLAAKALGARVIAIDPLETRRVFAKEMGADLTLTADANIVQTLRDATVRNRRRCRDRLLGQRRRAKCGARRDPRLRPCRLHRRSARDDDPPERTVSAQAADADRFLVLRHLRI